MSEDRSEVGKEAGSAVRSVVVEKEFAHPPEKVWRALTEGDLIKQWLMENDFQPVVGRRFQFRLPPKPYERLSYRWDSLGLESVVAWTLTPTEGGTLVRMEQTGFRDDQEAAYKGATYGWKGFFGGLERVVGELV
jgi:uncharacterized protein YndB with AHSA1/START domain